MGETEKSRRDRFTGRGTIQPGAGVKRKLPQPPKAPPGTTVARKVGKAIGNAIRGGNPSPEKSPEWKARQRKIEDRQAVVGGARYIKRQRGGRA